LLLVVEAVAGQAAVRAVSVLAQVCQLPQAQLIQLLLAQAVMASQVMSAEVSGQTAATLYLAPSLRQAVVAAEDLAHLVQEMALPVVLAAAVLVLLVMVQAAQETPHQQAHRKATTVETVLRPHRIMGLGAAVALQRLVQTQQEARAETAEMELLQQFLAAALLMLAGAVAAAVAELKEQAVAVAGVEHKQQPMELLELKIPAVVVAAA
jgi:hypothetical protein